jgi:protein-L-isoaspartate(D-aspartate) O-methyltransferase
MSRRNDPAPGAAIVAQVREHGIHDARILRALARVPRERFVPPSERPYARDDRALPIGLNQTISQPFIVALMSLELALTGTERVLEIGTGSGYQTAILAALATEVFTIERLRLLSLRARGLLDGLGFTNVRYSVGDGTLGWPQEAPFDRIIVTAAAPTLPDSLFDQVAEGGLAVAPLGDEAEQHVTVIRKQGGQPVCRKVLPCRFVRLIGEQGWAN